MVVLVFANASTLSTLISDREREQGRVDTWDNVYPTTREETDRMEQLLDEAERVADAPNEDDYSQRLHDLREVEDWLCSFCPTT